jgi:hypothetical protein
MKRNIVCNVDESGVLFTNLPRREVLHAPMLPNQDPNLSPNGRRFQATLIQVEITLIQQPADRPQTNQKLKQIALTLIQAETTLLQAQVTLIQAQLR